MQTRPPAGLPSYLSSLYEVPILTAEQEVYLFRKYNFLKFCAAQIRQQLDAKRPQSRFMDQIEREKGSGERKRVRSLFGGLGKLAWSSLLSQCRFQTILPCC